MANPTQSLNIKKQKGQILMEIFVLILFALGSLYSLSLAENFAKKEIHKKRLNRHHFKNYRPPQKYKKWKKRSRKRNRIKIES